MQQKPQQSDAIRTEYYLSRLNERLSLRDKLESIYGFIHSKDPDISRVAVALYEEETDTLRTFLQRTEGENPLPFYDAKLSESKSLMEIRNDKTPRTINNLGVLEGINKEHSEKLLAHHFQSSYTVPIFNNDIFLGFIFFNSYEVNAMNANVISDLNMAAHIINMLIANETTTLESLNNLTHTLMTLTRFRDIETGTHLARVAQYAKLIATKIAPLHALSDDFVEYIFMFSPLHDIGKIGVTDKVLLKPGPLTDNEFLEIRQHPKEGYRVVSDILEGRNVLTPELIKMVQNIVLYHHERWDGMGYPEGLSKEEIPLEARIIAVADVCDALSSQRPYKKSWSLEETLVYLKDQSGSQFDPQCVDVFLQQKSTIYEINQLFE